MEGEGVEHDEDCEGDDEVDQAVQVVEVALHAAGFRVGFEQSVTSAVNFVFASHLAKKENANYAPKSPNLSQMDRSLLISSLQMTPWEQ